MSTKPHILIVDSEEDWYQPLHNLLDNEFDISHAKSFADAKKEIGTTEKPFDIVITEISLEGKHDEAGLDLIDYVEDGKTYTRIIVLTWETKIAITGKIKRVLQNPKVDFELKTPTDGSKFNFSDFVQIVNGALAKIYVYVFMSFHPEYTDFYKDHIKPTVENLILKCERADHKFNPKSILEKVKDGIQKSAIILVDVSGGRPDVYFEAGLSQAMYRSVIILSRDDKCIPPMIEGIEIVPYDENDFKGLEAPLTKAIKDVQNNSFLPNLKKVDHKKELGYCLALVPDTEYGTDVYENIIQPAVQKENLQITPVSEIHANSDRTQKILEELQKAHIIVADIGQEDREQDFENLQAYRDTLYLTGLAYGLGKEVILMKRKKNDVPHCLKSSSHISYTNLEIKRQEDINKLNKALRSILVPHHIGGKTMNTISKFDIVILTILPEEFQAVKSKIPNLQRWLGEEKNPNLYAWQTGSINAQSGANYKVAVGMIGRAGNTNSALAVKEALEQWSPRYVFFVGVAGGLKQLNKGDVVLADIIYGYEYGKMERKFSPRMDWSYRTDQGLLTGATAYSLDNSWKNHIAIESPKPCNTKFSTGIIASGEKVVDDPTNEFFAQVLQAWPRITAVEMEGAGAASAIEQGQASGKPVGFIVVRGISDVPRTTDETDTERGTKERDDWKPYASAAAAAFTVGYIADGLPVPPKEND